MKNFSFGLRSRVTAAFFLAAAAFVTVAQPETAEAKVMANRCGAGIILVGVRGTGEKPGMGTTVGIVKGLFDSDKDIPTWSQSVTYPAIAIGVGQTYMTSVKTGATNLRNLIHTIVNECPYSSINLAGYSQGADVIGDVLTGSGVTPLTATQKKHITSVVFFGDPTYRAGAKWNSSASGKGNGLFARPANAFASWTRLAYPSPSATKPVQMPIIRSYCYTGDLFCQKGTGSDAKKIHESYASRSTYAAYEFIRDWNTSTRRSAIPVVRG